MGQDLVDQKTSQSRAMIEMPDRLQKSEMMQKSIAGRNQLARAGQFTMSSLLTSLTHDPASLLPRDAPMMPSLLAVDRATKSV